MIILKNFRIRTTLLVNKDVNDASFMYKQKLLVADIIVNRIGN